MIDIETTGFAVSRDSIIEIALIKVDEIDDKTVVEEFEFLVRPPEPIPKKIRELTGITNEMVADAEAINRVLPKVKSLVGSELVVAHNADFDRRFLEAKANLLQITFSENEWVCTMMMSKRAFPTRVNHRLQDWAETFDYAGDSHRALADCKVTLELYLQTYDVLDGDVFIKPLELVEFENEDGEDTQAEFNADFSNDAFVFSGFRDDVLAARIEECGGTIKSGISRKVTYLLIKEHGQSTGKVKKAKEYDIAIKTRDEFTEEFYA